MEQRRDAPSSTPKYPGSLSKRIFLVVWGPGFIVMKAVGGLMTFPPLFFFWLQCGGDVAMGLFVAVLLPKEIIFDMVN